jgi:hypothetical protein
MNRNRSRLFLSCLALATFPFGAGAQSTTGGMTTGGMTTGGSSVGSGSSFGGLSGLGGGSSGGGTFAIDTANLDTNVKSNSGTVGYPQRIGNRGTTSTADRFSPYYINAMAIQYSLAQTGSVAVTPFGTPMYASLYPGTQITSPFAASTANVTGLTRVSPAGTGGFGSLGSFGTSGFGTVGYKAPPAYTTSLGFKYEPVPAKVQADVQEVLARSSRLPKSLQVALDGPTVVLRGKVPDAEQRRLAENLVKLTPGVKAVRNEVEVEPKAGQ